MRFGRFGLLVCLSFLSVSVLAQQPLSSQQATTQPPAPQDSQAVSVLNQALTASGGAAAIKAIADYTATGNVTYHWNPAEQGPLTIQGLGFTDIRFDASLSSGLHSESIHDGQTSTKNANEPVRHYPPAYPVPSSDAFDYQLPLFPSGFMVPQIPIAFVVNNPTFSISYKGIVQVNGTSAHDIQVQLVLPKQSQTDRSTEYRTIELLIDASSYLVTMTRDTVSTHASHEVYYSSYTLVNGIMVPFSISEVIGNQNTRDIQLNKITFNLGLQDSAFIVQ
jgi:hypothetical protein